MLILPKRDFEDISQLTNWIVDSSAICHMTTVISNFILVSLLETNKYTEVAYGNFFTAKQIGEVQIKMCDNNGNPSLLCYIT